MRRLPRFSADFLASSTVGYLVWMESTVGLGAAAFLALYALLGAIEVAWQELRDEMRRQQQ